MQAIFIDCGHGKSSWGLRDQGACRTYGGMPFRERDFAKEITAKIKTILAGKKELKDCLIQTVGLESEATPGAKMSFVNNTIRENKFTPANCLSISIHMNSVLATTANGFEVWYQKKGGKATKLAEKLVSSWKEYKILPLRPRPLSPTSLHAKWHRLYIDDAICPAALVETAFISNYTDAMTVKNNFDRVAECLAHGVMEYVRNI